MRMKKLVIRLCFFIIPVMIYAGECVFVDAYNVFHVDNVRLTDITPNQNFIKTKYLLQNKGKFNALLLGSSRVANLPKEGLPEKTDDGRELNWYNMTYAMGSPSENYDTVKTLIDGGVKLDELIILIDDISMWKGVTKGLDNPIFTTYQTYEESPIRFYYSYLKLKPVWRIVPQIFFEYRLGENNEGKKLFYSYGVDVNNTNMEIGSAGDMPEPENSLEYDGGSGAVGAIKDLSELCKEQNIRLIVVTSPILESTYEMAISNGYLDFLYDVAQVTDYYLFSGINTYTVGPEYYFDASHFRPVVGLEMEKVMFGDEDVRNMAVEKAKNDMSLVEFGRLVTKENAVDVIENLEQEINELNRK